MTRPRGISIPGPGHSSRDKSLSVTFDPTAPDGFWVNSFAGDDWRECRDYVRAKFGLAGFSRRQENSTRVEALSSRRDNTSRQNGETYADQATRALAIWHEAHDPRGTPVERYLKRRLGEEVGISTSSLRYHPSCPFAGKRTPAMVALVRDIVTDEPRAIHRTALSLEGHKLRIGDNDRLSLGPLSGGAIKLTADGDVTTCLGIGEGLESTLSLRLAPEFGCSPVWCLLSAGGVERFPVLVGIECLWIAVDHDAAGLRAARTCAERWRAAGCEVFLVKPLIERADLNDTVKGRKHHA